LKCESMQAQMDRFVVFKDGQQANKGAQVETVLCEKRVYVLDEQRDEAHRLVQASILECTDLKVDNLQGPTRASGPGRLRHLAPGDSDVGAPGTADAAPAKQGGPKDKEMKLTRIDFNGWMYSNTKAK